MPETNAPAAMNPAADEVYAFPASFAQQRLWFMDQLEPGSAFYNIPAAVRLKGRLDIQAMKRSLDEIVRRHETLRTTFASQDGQPVQIVSPAADIPFQVTDLQHLLPAEREAEALRRVEAEARRPFDLQTGPLLRVHLLVLAPEDHIIVLAMHHIISDGWSMGVLVREIAILYEAFTGGRPSPLPELPIQYADYAIWQRERLEGSGINAQIEYWKHQLAGDIPILKLPTDRPRPAVQSFHGSTCSRKIDARSAAALRALARAEDSTLFMLMLAAFQVLLGRYSGQEDLCIGSPIANRTLAETEGLIGFFVNTLVLRADLSGEPTFRDFLKRVRKTTLDAYSNQDLPFDSLIEAIQPERNLSVNPLFQVMFILQNAPARSYQLPGLSMESLDAETGTSTFDLTLSISELPDGLDAAMEYNTDLFDPDTVEQILTHYIVLLEGILADPDQAVSRYNLLTPAERKRIIFDWNDTARDFPLAHCTIAELFARQVAATPEAEALVWRPPEPGAAAQRITYRELDARANCLARRLQKLGVGPDVIVGICAERSVEMVVAVLGVLKTGGAYLPIDPSYPAERLAYMLSDSGVAVLLTQARLLDALPEHGAQTICLDRDWAEISQEEGSPLACAATPENLAYLIYTSGSTGRPKGVLVSQRSITNAYLSWEEAYQLRHMRSHLQMANFAFDVFTGDLVRALCSGGKLVLCPRDYLLSPADLYALMREEAIDIAEFVPAVLRGLVNYLTETRQNLAFMRLLICGSDIWYVEEYRAIQSLCGPETRLVNSFGLTEATIDSSYYADLNIQLPPDAVVPIGRPFANTRLYILDRHMQPLPALVPGELFVGGLGVARGYLNHPELTAEKFLRDPFSANPNDVVYRTGDMARYLKDGTVEFIGRMDYQVKIRGFRVEVGEVESTLRQHPAIRDAIVTALSPRREDGHPSARDQRLVAYLVSDLAIDRIPVQVACQARRITADGGPFALDLADLSEGGAHFEDVPAGLEPGERLSVTFHWPEIEEAVTLEGSLTWKQGRSAGMAFAHTPQSRHSLLHFLREARQKMPEMAGLLVQDLRRAQTRIPVRAECLVRWNGSENSRAGVDNISRGGLRLVARDHPWERGQRLEMQLSLPDSGAAITTCGVVWWVREDWVGIRFDPRPGEQAEIDRVIQNLLQANEFTLSQLRAYLKARLPDHMVPSAYVFLDSLPLTPNGKLDRKALPEPDWSHLDIQTHYIAPRTPVEEALAAIWQGVLGVEKVGVEDNFFELGGHSLLATQVVSRMRDAFHVEMPLRRIFEMPTIAALALEIETLRQKDSGGHAPPIRPADRSKALQLSYAQQRLWFLDQLEPDSPFYNIPESIRLIGRLDVCALERAVNEIIRRHEVLRTTFETVDGLPIQVIHPELVIELPVDDLRSIPAEERSQAVLRLVQQEAQKPFNLSRGPLLRARLLRLAEADHIVLLTMHHIIGDDWSSNILIQEVAALYPAFSEGRPSPLPELILQYADYAAWQRSYLSGEVLENQLAYWKKKLAGIPPLIELPTDRPRPAVQTFRGAYQTFSLPAGLSQNLTGLARREGVSQFMLLLAAFQVLLARYSGQEDICVGTPIANRGQAELESLIGLFVNTLVLRADFSQEMTFRAFLQQVRETCLEAYAHQELPFEKLVDALQPERNLSHSPLFQVMFVIQNSPRKGENLPGLRIETVEAHPGTAKFDLTCFMLEEEGRLAGAIEYNTDLFDSPTITRLIEHFEILLGSIVKDPDCLVGRLPLLPERERRLLIDEWNATQAPFPADRCTHQLIEEQARRTPGAVAVRYKDQSLTYAELDRRANRLAHFLAAQGVGPDVCVGLCMERSLEMMVGLLGILKAGGAYVPLDPHYPAERLAFMFEDCSLSVLLTQQAILGQIPPTRARTVCLDSNWAEIEACPDSPVESGVGPENLAYVIYTSGSTGKPKGAMIIHRGLVNYLTWCRQAYPLEAGQGTPVHSSISFDLTVTSLFPVLLAGRTVHMLPEEQGVEALGDFMQRVDDNCLIKITPAHLKLIGEQMPPGQAARCTHAFIIGGENLLVDHIDFWQKYAPQTALVNEYGPTETVVGCCCYWAPPGKHQAGVIPIGKPIINTRLYVLDRYLQPVPIGVRGELYIGGVGVARGYLNRPELTAERFLPDPFNPEPGARMYKSGDLVRWLPDGNLECLGRMDFQVKIRGFRVELGEVESALSLCPGVKETAVWVREDGGVKRLVAYYVAEDPSSPPEPAGLRESLRQRLPDYMIPYAFVRLDALPLTPNGKLDRKLLPAPEAAQSAMPSAGEPPSTPAERVLAAIWQAVLGVKQVNRQDNFFELGGDSILAIQVVYRARQQGLQINPRQVFENPTVAGLAQAAGAAACAQAEQGLVEGEVILTPIQRWFFELDLPHPEHWNQSLMLRFDAQVDAALVEKALLALIEHHDALRLTFSRLPDGTWQARHAPPPPAAPLLRRDISTLNDSAQRQALQAAAAEVQAGFDLAQGPLLRAGLFWLGRDRGARLLIAAHHLAFDGFSWRILLEDLQTAFEQLTRGEAVSLLPKSTSFQAWAAALAEFAASPAVLAELPWWLEAPETPSLRLDDPNGSNRECDAETLPLSLDEPSTQFLAQAAARYHCDMQTLLLAGLAQALRACYGEQDWQIELEGHGREEIGAPVDISRTIGWFTTQYPLHIRLAESGPAGAVRAVKEALNRLHNKGFGFGLLAAYHPDPSVRLELKRRMRGEICFNYLGQSGGLLDESPLGLAGESRGAERHPQGLRPAVWEINGGILGGCLGLDWTYSTGLHRRETMEKLLDAYRQALLEIAAGSEPASAQKPSAEDFRDFNWGQTELDEIMGELKEFDEFKEFGEG